jgi:hypothetical protein
MMTKWTDPPNAIQFQAVSPSSSMEILAPEAKELELTFAEEKNVNRGERRDGFEKGARGLHVVYRLARAWAAPAGFIGGSLFREKLFL